MTHWGAPLHSKWGVREACSTVQILYDHTFDFEVVLHDISNFTTHTPSLQTRYTDHHIAYFQKWPIEVYMASLGWKAHSTTLVQHLKQYPEGSPCGTYTKKFKDKQHASHEMNWFLGLHADRFWVPQSGANFRPENKWPTVGSLLSGSNIGSVWRPAFWHRGLTRWWVAGESPAMTPPPMG
jgi:hypothetical protein